MSERRRGHRTRPHTADVRIEAWGPTAEACYEEAVAALVAVFADVTGAPAGVPQRFAVGPGSPERLLVQLVDEVLTGLDADGLVPRAARVEQRGDTLVGELVQVPVGAVRVTGSVAKGVSFQGLRFGPDGRGRWRCRAIVDV
jgi:SHS2 domain-containing protein